MADDSAAIARLEVQIENLDRRMANLEKLTESVQTLALSIQELATKQSSTEHDVEALTNEVAEIRDKPAKRWDAIVAALIAGLVGAFLGRFIK